MNLQLITPEEILFEGEASMVTAPGVLGEFGVLPGHAPFVSTLKPGVIVIDLPGQEQRKMAVLSGIAEVLPERMTVLAEAAEDCTGMTRTEAEAQLQAARAELEEAVSDAAKAAAEQKIRFAEAILGGMH